jgi:hypothetical protein
MRPRHLLRQGYVKLALICPLGVGEAQSRDAGNGYQATTPASRALVGENQAEHAEEPKL